MKTSGTFNFLFVALMLFSLICCSQLRQDRPACTTPGVDRNTCDEGKNSYGANKCRKDNDCYAGRKCGWRSRSCY